MANRVSVSPHITSEVKTQNIMLDVIIALMPTTIAAALIFGFYSWLTIAFAIGGSVLGEFLFNKVMKKPNTLSDLSAVVTGLLLGLNLPPIIPFYVPLIGGIFATLVVKMLFGGIGKNFANPALTARIFLILCWGGLMTTWVKPIDLSQGFGELFKYFTSTSETITTATPLSYMKNGSLDGSVTLLDMFLGKMPGSCGEVSAIALIIGGIYLAIKKVIDIKIPLIFIGTVALCTLIFYKDVTYVLPQILSGGLMLGAIFMATDYATSPNTTIGVCIYAFGCGLLTVIIRKFGNLPEGVSFAILLMNIVTPLLDKYIIPRPLGYVKTKREKEVKA